MAGARDLGIAPPGAPEVEVESGTPVTEAAPAELEPAPQVDDSIVRGLLRSMGGLAGHVVGDPDVPDHWRFSAQELDDLVPPLTRIINRREALRRAVVRGDEITVAVVLAGYAGRNTALARDAKEARGEVDREVGAPAGAGGAPGGAVRREPGMAGVDGGGVRDASRGAVG